MRAIRSAASLVAAAAIAFGAPALANQPDASDPPRVSGPLVGLPFGCEDNGPAGPGEVKGQSCSWSYNLAADTAAQRDFSAYWVQMEIDPGKGNCALELDFDVDLPEEIQLVSATHDSSRRLSKKTGQTSRLVVDGGGTAPASGTIEQDLLMSNGRETVAISDHTYSYKWRGKSKTKIVLAIGLQMSHASPPDLFTTWSEGQGMAMGSCRPIIIRVAPR